MNLKNINKFIILYLLFFNFSCSELEILNKKNSDYNIVNNYELETDQIIINSNKFSNINFNDFYSKNKDFTWKKLKPLEKKFTLNLGEFDKTGSYVSNFLVQDNSVYFMDKNVFREMSLIDGKEIKNMSEVLHRLADVEPIYESHKGWKSTTTGIAKFKDLPQPAQNYITYLEGLMNIPIIIISTGPGRDEILRR